MRLRFFTSIAVSLCSAVFLAAQSGSPATPQQEQRPTFKTEANYVRVDVYPTKDGVAVTSLTAEDFQVFEDDKPQAIATFEHVVVRSAGPQAMRAEPNTINESREMARNPRARVVVLFLDVPHVTAAGSWTIREPLLRLLDRILGPEDLVGVMTPAMSPADLVLARKTDVLAGGLRDRWPWGERGTIETNDQEKLYWDCYAIAAPDVLKAMTARRRERATLEALDELVRHLRDLRDERKAIVTVTEGWLLYRPNEDLRRLRTSAAGLMEPPPRVDPITVDPNGRLTTKNTRGSEPFSRSECEADRLRLATIDDFQFVRDLMDEANRANATFYTIDPRGLVVFDTPIGPEAPPAPAVDAQMLRARQDTMRMLASNTDGVAVLGSNDLDKGLQRIGEDLTSYYLVGYYSTTSKPDGKFHKISVRVNQPGVQVRARRGYRAATVEEVARARKSAVPPVPDAAAPLANAVDALSRIRPEARLHVNVVPQGSAGAITQVWIAGEFALARDGVAPPTAAEVEIIGGGTSESTRVALAPGQRSFLTSVPLTGMDASAIDVRVRLSGSGADATTDSVSATLSDGMSRPLLFRRGPSTGNRQQAAASFLFSRTERIRLEFPIAAGSTPVGARLLDKTGHPISIPVATGERTDSAQRWMTADAILAPLAPGDYVIEVTVKALQGEQRSITAIRVTR